MQCSWTLMEVVAVLSKFNHLQANEVLAPMLSIFQCPIRF